MVQIEVAWKMNKAIREVAEGDSSYEGSPPVTALVKGEKIGTNTRRNYCEQLERIPGHSQAHTLAYWPRQHRQQGDISIQGGTGPDRVENRVGNKRILTMEQGLGDEPQVPKEGRPVPPISEHSRG